MNTPTPGDIASATPATQKVVNVGIYITEDRWMALADEDGNTLVITRESHLDSGTRDTMRAALALFCSQYHPNESARLHAFLSPHGEKEMWQKYNGILTGIAADMPNITTMYRGFEGAGVNILRPGLLETCVQAVEDYISSNELSLDFHHLGRQGFGTPGEKDAGAEPKAPVRLRVATDGSYSHYQSAGGFGAVFDTPSTRALQTGGKAKTWKEPVHKFIRYGYRRGLSINELEVLGAASAVQTALKLVPDAQVDLYTDSAFVCVAVRERLWPGFKGAGDDKRAIHALYDAYENGQVRVHKVKGHSGHDMNECADRIAVTARRLSLIAIDGSELAARLTAIADEYDF